MHFDALGSAKLKPLHSCLAVDKGVHHVGLEPAGGDGEQVIHHTQGGGLAPCSCSSTGAYYPEDTPCQMYQPEDLISKGPRHILA